MNHTVKSKETGRWILASERLPEIAKRVIIRNFAEDNFVANGKFYIETDGSRFISTPSVNGNRWRIEDVEWLDESPSTQSEGWMLVADDKWEAERNYIWCKVPVNEPYYCGSALDEHFPRSYFTHYRELPEPPQAPVTEKK